MHSRNKVFLQLSSLPLTYKTIQDSMNIHHITEYKNQRVYQFGGNFKFQHTITTHAKKDL